MLRTIQKLKLFQSLNKVSLPNTSVNPFIARFVNTADQSAADQENWTEIYRLPLVRLASAFNKLKVYQALVTAIGTPGVFALENAGQLAPDYGVVFAAFGVTGLVTLTVGSLVARNIIGFVYMNEQEDKIKLAYVDFWGRRQDRVLVVDDILAQWELPPRRINAYHIVRSRENESQSFKLLYRYGVVRDPQRYAAVFGDDNV